MPDPVGEPRWLDAPTVERHLPPIERALELAALVLSVVGRVRRAPDPSTASAKVVLPPGPAATFAQAMAARLDAAEAPDGRPLLGMKWIAGNPANRARGIAAMASVVVLNDPATGHPVAILDGSPITAARTAALTGAAIRLLSSERTPPGTALVLGAGVQGRAHLPVLAALGFGRILVHDRHPERAGALVAAAPPGVAVEVVTDVRGRIGDAEVVVSCTTTAVGSPWIGPGDLAPHALVVPVDYDAQVTPELVAGAAPFAVDDAVAWAENRARGRLAGWPEPTTTLAALVDARRAGTWSRPPGRAVALHQGPGLADVVFADAVLRSLEADPRY